MVWYGLPFDSQATVVCVCGGEWRRMGAGKGGKGAIIGSLIPRHHHESNQYPGITLLLLTPWYPVTTLSLPVPWCPGTDLPLLAPWYPGNQPAISDPLISRQPPWNFWPLDIQATTLQLLAPWYPGPYTAIIGTLISRPPHCNYWHLDIQAPTLLLQAPWYAGTPLAPWYPGTKVVCVWWKAEDWCWQRGKSVPGGKC